MNGLKLFFSAMLVLASPATTRAQFGYAVSNGTVTNTNYTGPAGPVVIPGSINAVSVSNSTDPDFYALYENALIPPPPAELFTWPTKGCNPTFDAKYVDSTVPIGTNSFKASSQNCDYFGWGIFTNVDMSAFGDGQISFYFKSMTPLEVQLQDVHSNKATVLLSSTDGQWQQTNILINTFADQGLDLGNMYGLFLITDTNGPTTFYVADVAWVKNVLPNGSLQVTISPPEAVADGAQWQVDGGALQNSGAIVSYLSAGSHTLSFNAINGWNTPEATTVSIVPNVTVSTNALYVSSGSLSVTISPSAVTPIGAQWQVGNSGWQNSGAIVSNVPVGTYIVNFEPIDNWKAPSNVSVTINQNELSKANGQYDFGGAGTYNGLFASEVVTPETAGMLANFETSQSGVYSGKLFLDQGKAFLSLAGTFDGLGRATNSIRRAGKLGPVNVAMWMNWNSSPPTIGGIISGTNGGLWNSTLLAEQAFTGATSSEYTSWILPAESPPGYGYMLITNHAGMVTLNVSLADGATFMQTVPLSGLGDLPVYCDTLYANAGLVCGWIGMESGGPAGTLTWIKPAVRPRSIYMNGFTNEVTVQGALWTNPPTQMAAIDLPSGQLTISGGGLASDLVFNVAISSNNSLMKLAGSPTNSLSGLISPETGKVTIKFGNGKATMTGTAAAIQTITNAAGFFLGKTNAGLILLQPQ